MSLKTIDLTQNRKWMRRLAGVLALLFVAFPMPSVAGPLETGTDFRKSCLNKVSLNDEIFCKAYIAGVYDTLGGLAEAGALSKSFCTPPGTKLIDVRNMMRGLLRDRDEHLEYSAAYVVFNALSVLYPCNTSSG